VGEGVGRQGGGKNTLLCSLSPSPPLPPSPTLGERGRKEQRLPLPRARHVLPLDDAPDLGLKPHVEHAVGFVQREVADAREGDARALDEVGEAAGRSDQHVGAALHVAQLVDDGGAAVDDDGADADLRGRGGRGGGSTLDPHPSPEPPRPLEKPDPSRLSPPGT